MQINLPSVAERKTEAGIMGNAATSLLGRHQSVIFIPRVEKIIAGM
jgi:hypothetical protein